MNSLTANNRLSQQLVVSVAEHLLLRHECRLPNHLAVSNHRELYLTVGGELCRNLTAGFVTEEGFMSMLFVGSQKHSALSIFAKTTRMSALALCGNSGVILLSVKDHQHIDSAIPGRYTVQAPYKAGVGIGVLELHTATIGALASFLLLQLSYTQIMVGWVGAPKGAPVSVCAGYANPAQFTTSEIGVSGGGSYPLHTEAAIMATVPALSRLNDEDLSGQAADKMQAGVILLDFMRRELNLSNSSVLGACQKLQEAVGLPNLAPRYAIDAPADAPDGSSRPTLSLSALLKQYGIRLTANQAYHQMAKLGIVEQRERYSRTAINNIKKFWSLTAKGCMFGKNITSPANPRETQPHFFESRFPELLKLLDTVH